MTAMLSDTPTRQTPLLHRFSSMLAARLPFYYGYVMVAVAMLLQVATSPGQTFAMSAFAPSLRRDLNLSSESLSLAYAMGTMLAALPLSLLGPMLDRVGLRRMTLVVLVGLAGACAAASMVTGWWTVMLAFLSLRFLAQGSLSLIAGNSVSMWFKSRIGRVGAVMSLAMAFAFALVPPAIADAIEQIGWRSTYRWIAVVVLVSGLPTVLLLFRNRPAELGQSVDGIMPRRDATIGGLEGVDGPDQPDGDRSLDFATAIRTPTLYILAMVTTLWAMIGTGVVFHLYSICDAKGLSETVPDRLFGIFGLSMLAAQLLGGVAADFWRLNRLLSLGTMMLAVGVWATVSGHPQAMVVGFGGLFGAGQGLLIAVTGAAWVQYYGPDHLGKIRGTVWCATVAGSGLGPLLLGASSDRLGSYNPALVAVAVALSVATPIACLAVQPRRQV